MKRWLIAAAVALLLSAWAVFGLAGFSASMMRLAHQQQDVGARPTDAERAGMALARFWEGYTPLVVALVAALCFIVAFGVAHIVGRKASRRAA
jgi:hypothetical protein